MGASRTAPSTGMQLPATSRAAWNRPAWCATAGLGAPALAVPAS